MYEKYQDSDMYIEPDSSQIVIKLKKGGNISSAMQKWDEILKSRSQINSSRLNSSIFEEENSHYSNTKIRNEVSFINVNLNIN